MPTFVADLNALGGSPPTSLRAAALQALCLSNPAEKAATTRQLYEQRSDYRLDVNESLLEPQGIPGRPPLPRLVSPKDVPARSPFTAEGRAALLHSIAHIEFNAINLALDAVWRFGGMPEDYYTDWLKVASEEALHFTLLRDHLQTLGVQYGDFDAHDGLWSMTQSTASSIIARMALVPRTLEARGLDATPPIQAKLRRAGDARAVDILDIILRDEVGHVAIGNHWYRWLCAREGLDAEALYPDLVQRYFAPKLRPPFNLGARRQAGFSEAELTALEASH
jgi:uncharacterized ferritin-like protein (DUF455 family)